MKNPIQLGIVGYGNLGQGVVSVLPDNPDCHLRAIFTRRDPSSIKAAEGLPLVPLDTILDWKQRLDVLLLCTGSATDLPAMAPALAAHFNIVDSYDNHTQIPAHFAAVDHAAKQAGTLALISAGWDPGLFSLFRVYSSAVLPQGKSYTFWGKGISQGHSDAIRRIPGVRDARQYTIPSPRALEQLARGETPNLSPQQMHTRLCLVLAEDGADHDAIEQAIRTMTAYFTGYETTVHFLTSMEWQSLPTGLAHGGQVLHNGNTGTQHENRQRMSFQLQLDSNPQFTASVMVACARAVFAMHHRGEIGCRTILDVPPAALSPFTEETLLQKML